jgi:hypothetical protein
VVVAPGVNCPSASNKGDEESIGKLPVSASGFEAFGPPSASASISIREMGRSPAVATSEDWKTLGELDWFWFGLRAGADDGCSSCPKTLLKTAEKRRGDEASCEAGGFSTLAGDVWPLELRFDAPKVCEDWMPGSEAAGPDKRFTPPTSADQRPNGVTVFSEV